MKKSLKLYKIKPMKFSAFNIENELVSILEQLGYVEPTPIQQIVIPKGLKSENLVAKSETGSGKTHSFLIPIINNLEENDALQAIILVPSRELARQTYKFANDIVKMYKGKNIKLKLFVSGEDSNKSLASFKNGCNLLIATPGRLKSLIESTEFDLSILKTLVLDEADMLLDNGFFPIVDSILTKCNKEPQIEVFSATIPEGLSTFLKKYIAPDYVVDSSKEELTSRTVKHYFVNTKHKDKNEMLLNFINQFNPYFLLVFANSKKKAREIYNFLYANKVKCGILSGELEARERKAMLRRINNDEFRVVVCSDLASRGLDISNVSDVVNVDLPNNTEYYYHRAGRTGRNFNTGNSYVFYDHDSFELPTKLIKDGLSVTFMKIDGDTFVETSNPISSKKKNKKIPTELDLAIKKAKSQTMSKKVKPGYKKKVKVAIDKVKRKHKREVIRKDIRRQREERYIQESKARNN